MLSGETMRTSNGPTYSLLLFAIPALAMFCCTNVYLTTGLPEGGNSYLSRKSLWA